MAGLRAPKSEIASIEIAPDALVDARRAVDSLLEDLRTVASDAAKITEALLPISSMSIDERWVRQHGEMLCKADAARVLSVSVGYLNKLIMEGYIACAPDGRVLVRSMCAWANGMVTRPRRRMERAVP